MKRKKLVIISHTEHYKNSDGIIVGWGATVNEINFLANQWEEVVHVGCFYDDFAPNSALPYTEPNITFAAIPPYGGKSIVSKLLLITKIPKIINQVRHSIVGASEVQLRLPTSMGLYLLPLFAFFWSRKFVFWVKYAGNWNQEKAPLSYRFQKWFLKNNFAKCKVTINGFWDKQPKHCLSFENPCLLKNDIDSGKAIATMKYFEPPYVFCFVGRLDEKKGMKHIVNALTEIENDKIKEFHFVGDSSKKVNYRNQLSFLREKIRFHGFLPKDEVHTILEKSHFIVLPSKSEGFPKVIAEAACYGTIPIVSNVGSIPHYINSNNGFVWDISSANKFEVIMQEAINNTPKSLKEKSDLVIDLATKFTFASYLDKLNKLILK